MTSSCLAGGLIKNMWLHSPRTLHVDGGLDSNVFPLLQDVCVSAQAASLYYLGFSCLSLGFDFICCPFGLFQQVALGFGQTKIEACWAGQDYSLNSGAYMYMPVTPSDIRLKKHNRDNIFSHFITQQRSTVWVFLKMSDQYVKINSKLKVCCPSPVNLGCFNKFLLLPLETFG